MKPEPPMFSCFTLMTVDVFCSCCDIRRSSIFIWLPPKTALARLTLFISDCFSKTSKFALFQFLKAFITFYYFSCENTSNCKATYGNLQQSNKSFFAALKRHVSSWLNETIRPYLEQIWIIRIKRKQFLVLLSQWNLDKFQGLL